LLSASIFNVADGEPLLPPQTLRVIFTIICIQSVGLGQPPSDPHRLYYVPHVLKIIPSIPVSVMDSRRAGVTGP
jgi:hypothetical protein